MPLIIESVRESQDGREVRYSGEFRYAEVLADTDPCERLETDLLMHGFTIPGLAYAIASKSERAVHAAFSGAGMRLENMEVEIDLRARCHILKIEFTVFRALRTPANPKVSVRADEAMRSLQAQDQEYPMTFQGAVIITANGRLQPISLDSRTTYTTYTAGKNHTQISAPNPKTVSPFSIGLGQRSIEV